MTFVGPGSMGEWAGPRGSAGGFSLVELAVALALSSTLVALSVPATRSVLDAVQTAAAARNVAERLAVARVDAVRRSTTVALRFEADADDYRFGVHRDGNGNGVRTAEISSGVDAAVGHRERLRDNHPGVAFGLLDGIPDLDGLRGNQDGVRIGIPKILSLSPDGSATSGTLYVHGRWNQSAVRILGATGRVRVFRYDTGGGRWISR